MIEDKPYWNSNPKPEPKAKKPYAGLKRSSIKQKKREPTGELELFKKIYDTRKGICCITKEWIPFHPESFMHVLSKGAFPSFRLEKWNILLVQREIHRLYDCSSKEKLLEKYPEAEVIYNLKDVLKEAYYKNIKR